MSIIINITWNASLNIKRGRDHRRLYKAITTIVSEILQTHPQFIAIGPVEFLRYQYWHFTIQTDSHTYQFRFPRDNPARADRVHAEMSRLICDNQPRTLQTFNLNGY